MDICKYRKLHHKEITSILEEKLVCSIGISSTSGIEIAPMFFVFDCQDENINFFICMDNTKKFEDKVNSEPVCIYLDNYISNFYRDAYQTIVAKGTLEILTDQSDKNYVMHKFKEKYYKPFKDIMSCTDLNFVKIPVKDICGREYNYDL